MKSHISQFLLFFLIFISFSKETFTQEFFVCNGDSLELVISDKYRGEIQWQSSDDSTIWENFPAGQKENIWIKNPQNKYFRAKITETNCPPVYSEIKVVKELEDSLLRIENNDFFTNVFPGDTIKMELKGANYYEVMLNQESIDSEHLSNNKFQIHNYNENDTIRVFGFVSEQKSCMSKLLLPEIKVFNTKRYDHTFSKKEITGFISLRLRSFATIRDNSCTSFSVVKNSLRSPKIRTFVTIPQSMSCLKFILVLPRDILRSSIMSSIDRGFVDIKRSACI